MQMKTHIRYYMATAAVLLLCSCVKEQLEKGTPDREDCMGVYFLEEQENIKTHTLEKGVDKTSLSFIVRRTDTESEATVPFTTEVFYIQEEELTDTSTIEKVHPVEDLFVFSTIKFAKGESETTVNVRFDRITTGLTYTCNLSITDPEYASMYAYNPTSISFSVQMYEWTRLPQKATYRDGFFSDMFDWDGKYLETEVDIYQRRDMPGYYRLHNVYDAEYFARLVEGDEAYNEDPEGKEKEYSSYVAKDHYLYLDATDPERVWFPAQKTGFTDPSLGDIIIASDVSEVFGATSNLLYGKLVDNVITFPKNGLNFGMGEYYYFSNTAGKFRIVLPGGEADDYSIDIEAKEVTPEGAIPVTFDLAKDVKKVKYSLFEGRLAGLALTEAIADVESSGTELVPGEGKTELEVKPLKADAATGIYTLVACTYGSGDTAYREYSTVEVGYVRPGEDRKVQIFFGVHTDDRFASDKESENYSSKNSFQYWVRGKDITHAQISYYPTAYYNAYEDMIKEDMISYGTLSSAYIKMINSGELSGIIGNQLKEGTSYTMVIYAGNGYHSEFFTKSVTTSGNADPMQKAYYYPELRTESAVGQYTSDKWIPVSVDIFDPEAKGRTIRGRKNGKGEFEADTVVFRAEGEKMIASGLFPSLASNPDITFDMKDNRLVTTENKLNQVYVKDTTHFIPTLQFEYLYRPKIGSLDRNGYFYDSYEDDDKETRYDWMTAGFVDDDIIAFTDNHTDYVFWSFTLGGYRNIMGEDTYYQIIGDGHGDLILVKAGSPLLDGLMKKESAPMKENQVLNSITEQNRIEMPELGTLITDQKKFDVSHDMMELNADVKINNNIKKY